MAEQVNGDHQMDVEMKEEGHETTIDSAPPVPVPLSMDAQQANTPSLGTTVATEGHESLLDGASTQMLDAGVAEAQAPAEAPVEAPGQAPSAVPAPPAAAVVATAPASVPVSTSAPVPVQAPVSAPTLPPAAAAAPAAAAVAAPSRPSSIPPPAGIAPPERPSAHGSPTRVYLNQNVTPHLLEGVKYLAAYEPEKPLEWLSGFLARRSAEVEGGSATS